MFPYPGPIDAVQTLLPHPAGVAHCAVLFARLAALSILLAVPRHAAAQSSSTVSGPTQLDPAANRRRGTLLAQLLAGLGLELVASVGVGLSGFAAGTLTTLASDDERNREAGVVVDARGMRVLAATLVFGSFALLPPATAWGVHGVGALRGEPGRYRAAWLGSLGCGAGAFALTFAIAWPALALNHDQPGMGAAAIASGPGFLGFLAGAMLGERRSRGRPGTTTAPRTQLLPALYVRESHGASFGLIGTF